MVALIYTKARLDLASQMGLGLAGRRSPTRADGDLSTPQRAPNPTKASIGGVFACHGFNG